MPKPHCIDDEPGIKALLNAVIDKLDKTPGCKAQFSINEKTFPDLFLQAEIADDFWISLQTLFVEPHAIFHFSKNLKINPGDSYHDCLGKNIIFNPETEPLIRQWLDRPKNHQNLMHWKQQVSQNAHCFPGDVSRLSAKKIKVAGKSFNEIIHGFIKINDFVNEELTLRNLSAKCFWQDSKFLDSKEDLIKQLYPDLKVKTRAIIVSVFLPQNIQGVLFVENQDSYNQALHGIPQSVENLAVVYSAGFELSAERIRELAGASLHFHHQSHIHMQKKFVQWWSATGNHVETDWPVYFWGDLDYAGMDILRNLK